MRTGGRGVCREAASQQEGQPAHRQTASHPDQCMPRRGVHPHGGNEASGTRRVTQRATSTQSV